MDQFLVLFFKLLHLGGIILPGIENFPGVGQKLFLSVGYQVRMKLVDLSRFRYGLDLFDFLYGNSGFEISCKCSS